MYVDVGSLIGSFSLFYGPSADEVALLAGQESALDAVLANNYSVMSDWFFQMVFVATAASIVHGTGGWAPLAGALWGSRRIRNSC